MSEIRKTISPIIGSYLKDLRASSKMSQDELGEKLGITGSYIGYVEKAKRLPSVEVVKSYARHFQVPTLTLLNLREITIFETVDLLGDAAPPAIKNERNMIVHAKRPDILSEAAATHLYESEDEYSSPENGITFLRSSFTLPDSGSKENIASAIEELTELEDLQSLLDELRRSKEELEKIEASLLAREKELVKFQLKKSSKK